MIETAGWPSMPSPDPKISAQAAYIRRLKTEINSNHSKKTNLYKKKDSSFTASDLDICMVYVADGAPSWMTSTVRMLKQHLKEHKSFPESRAAAKQLSKFVKNKKKIGQCMSYVSKLQSDYKSLGESVFKLSCDFDEVSFLQEQQEMLLSHVPCTKLLVEKINPDAEPPKGTVRLIKYVHPDLFTSFRHGKT